MKHKLIIGVGILFVIIGAVLLGSSSSSGVPQLLADIPDAKETQVVRLNDGDKYSVSLSYVMKEVGGRPIKLLAYNGSVPGPTIRVQQGSEITVVFTNDSDMKTLLHSHGVRMQDLYDGSQLVQKEMEPGETFEYKLRFPDAGAFWYHPHVRDDIQQAMGAYGNFIVEPADPNEFPKVDREETLTMGDMLIEGGDLAPFSKEFVTHALMGRFGNTMFMNGSNQPLSFIARPGEVVRYYVTNVASVRPFNLVIDGAEMKLVASDAGRYEKEKMVKSVEIHPSERYIIDVLFPEARTYAIEHRIPGGKTYRLGTVKVSGEPLNASSQSFASLRVADGVLAKEFALARTFLGKQPDKRLAFTVKTDMNKIMSTMMGGQGGAMDHSAMNHMHGATQPVEWEDTMGTMNIYSTDKNTTWVVKDMDTGLENMDVNWIFTKGEMVKVRLYNDPESEHPMQHPFHTHGNRFVVLATDGTPNQNLVWKDTTIVKAGETVDVLIDMSNPGKWMAHCHILEHLHSGMMIGYEVR
jgi:FtsP/CotA-like multicopper oxidase with cupredoxin domain